ncbi:hypothetical protein PGIGA_G00086500 [Pangasianodon gigas]|uniref:Uncharacterized protein n=1 Tax=Pangasianodon gigas TaxID=30993 RepID=A0ACC5XB82_PANGG|nr:hypothetical protein [Pangasianodon gigas]
MKSVFVGFVLLALVTVSHAACWSARINGATHCQDTVDKTWHPVGSSWTNRKCTKCSCDANLMKCCDGWPTRVYGDCIIKYYYKTCTYKVINTKIPGGTCSGVGK